MKEILNYIENSHFFKNYVRKSHWQSGSTIVYPIQVWKNPLRDGVDDIELQIDGSSCKQWRERQLKKLAEDLKAKFGITITSVHITHNDGSCPDEGHIYVKLN